MKLNLEPGRYVVAVSGGVDSMALLHMLQQHPGLKLTVAHFDHGIRPDSRQDMLLVKKIARIHGVPFVYGQGNLGPQASEDQARQARYKFLHAVRQAAGAKAVITAHHKDDALETAIINILRGQGKPGRKGFTSLKSIDIVKRPLLHMEKDELRAYAAKNQLEWREDSTNDDTTYLRNHIRHKVLKRLKPEHKEKFHSLIQDVHRINNEVDSLIEDYLQRYSYGSRLKRHEFIMLPHAVALEVMAAWLRRQGIRGFDKKMLERLTHAAKIHIVGKVIPIAGTNSTVNLKLNKEFLALEHSER